MSEMTVEECQRKWELPYDHPESFVQENATYRQIYNAARAAENEACARIEPFGLGEIIEVPNPNSSGTACFGDGVRAGVDAYRAAIRARLTKD